jgi:hypothetical protein
MKINRLLIDSYLSNKTKQSADVYANPRYPKSLNRLLKVCYVPAPSAVLIAFFSSFIATAINSTNEAKKAPSMLH